MANTPPNIIIKRQPPSFFGVKQLIKCAKLEGIERVRSDLCSIQMNPPMIKDMIMLRTIDTMSSLSAKESCGRTL